MREEEERKKKNLVKISSDKYFQISRAILEYFKQRERERSEEITETVVTS
jgi:hypothetical protein